MSVRCDVCALESTLDDCYYRVGFFKRRGRRCPTCYTVRLTNWLRIDQFCGLLCFLAGIVLVQLDDTFLLGWWFLAVGLYVVFQIACILPHELGHALVARAMNLRVFTICIGLFGRVLFSRRVFGADFALRTIPLGGYTLAAPKSVRLLRVRKFLFVLAGPLVNVAFVLSGLAALQRTDPLGSTHWIAKIFVVTNSIILAVNLWPHRITTCLGLTPNDGLTLLTIWRAPMSELQAWHASRYCLEGLECRERGRALDAIAWIKQGLELYPDDLSCRLWLALVLLEEGQYSEARLIYQATLEQQPPSSPLIEAILWNNIAYTNLLLDQPDLLPEADAFSQSAYERAGWMGPVKGTRGSALVELGDPEAAIPLLEQNLSTCESPKDRAEIAARLAIALIACDRFLEAHEYIALSKQLNPNCVWLERAEKRLQTVEA